MAVEIRHSGGENNTLGIGDIGGQVSDTAVVTEVNENVFDDISRGEALQGRTEYRCIYVFNNTAATATGVKLEVTTNPTLTHVSLGLDPVGKGDGRINGIATNIASEDESPTGVRFFGEDTASSDGPWDTVKLPIGILHQNECVAVWLKRTTETGIEQVIDVIIAVNHDAVTLPGEDVDDGGMIGELYKITTTETGLFKIDIARIGFSDIG